MIPRSLQARFRGLGQQCAERTGPVAYIGIAWPDALPVLLAPPQHRRQESRGTRCGSGCCCCCCCCRLLARYRGGELHTRWCWMARPPFLARCTYRCAPAHCLVLATATLRALEPDCLPPGAKHFCAALVRSTGYARPPCDPSRSPLLSTSSPRSRHPLLLPEQVLMQPRVSPAVGCRFSSGRPALGPRRRLSTNVCVCVQGNGTCTACTGYGSALRAHHLALRLRIVPKWREGAFLA